MKSVTPNMLKEGLMFALKLIAVCLYVVIVLALAAIVDVMTDIEPDQEP